MLEIKQALITCTAAAINNPGPSFEPQMQQQRIEWCDQVLDSLNILEPGLSIGRGIFFKVPILISLKPNFVKSKSM